MRETPQSWPLALTLGVYLAGLLLALHAISGTLPNLLGDQVVLRSALWRATVVGVVVRGLPEVLLGAFIISANAIWNGHSRTALVAAILQACAALAILVVLPLHLLDLLQVRAEVVPGVQGRILWAGAVTVLSALFGLAALASLSWATFRSRRKSRQGRSLPSKTAPKPLFRLGA